MNILLDMNASPEWVEPLQKLGYNCSHWLNIGDPKAPDEVIFQWAAQHNHVIYTHDLDFGAILAATNAQFPSVLQIRTQNLLPDSPEAVARIDSYLRDFAEMLTTGALVTMMKATHESGFYPYDN